MTGEILSEMLQWCAIVIVGLLSIGAAHVAIGLRNRMDEAQSAPLLPDDGLPIGSHVPDWKGENIRTGEEVGSKDFNSLDYMLLFLESNCAPCIRLIEHIATFAATNPNVRTVCIFKSSTPPRDKLDRVLARSNVWICRVGPDVFQHFDAHRTPLAFVIDASGNVAIKTIPNSLKDLTDTWEGKSRRQSSPWVEVSEGVDQSDRGTHEAAKP